MNDVLRDPALLWYLNRATGVVLMVLFTVVLALGMLATFGRAGRGAGRVVPRFATQALHRRLTLVATALLAGHVASAVADGFVDIRWWQAVVPFGATYRPLWLGLGALALDLLVLVVLSSLLRTRLGHRTWRAIHLAAYAAWALAVVHGLGIGTDASQDWSRRLTLGCAAVVTVLALARLVAVNLPSRSESVR